MGKEKKIGPDHADYEWPMGWDDRTCAAVIAEQEARRAACKAAKDGQQAKEKTDE